MPRRLIRYVVLSGWRKVLGTLRRMMKPHTHPRELARGAAVGMFMGLSPFIGLHLLVALALAYVFRANKLLALTLVFITNPWTALPIYIAEGRIGEVVLRSEERLFTVQAARQLVQPTHADETFAEHLRRLANHRRFGQLLGRVTIGWLIVGVPSAVAAYYAALRLGHGIQRRRLHRLQERTRARHGAPPPPASAAKMECKMRNRE